MITKADRYEYSIGAKPLWIYEDRLFNAYLVGN